MARRRQPVRTRPLQLNVRKVGQKCDAYQAPKIKWRTRLDAQMAMANANNKQGSRTARTGDTKREVRVYRCPHCHYFHTTSQDREHTTNGAG